MASPAITVTMTPGMAITKGTTNAANNPKIEKNTPFATDAA